jgi:flavin-binding protein dodecin
MAAAGDVHKVIRVIATSSRSWEDAALSAVAEATQTIQDLDRATLVKADSVIRDGRIVSYRVKLEMGFRIDRRRVTAGDEVPVEVRRYLVLANQTLPSPGLHELVAEKVSTGQAEFHILVPEGHTSAIPGDPMAAGGPALAEMSAEDRLVALDEAEQRLDQFRTSFSHLGSQLTGEVGVGEPMAATRRVMERAVFDEIIVSTLPSGISRWLRMDLPTRLERGFRLPVTVLVQDAA